MPCSRSSTTSSTRFGMNADGEDERTATANDATNTAWMAGSSTPGGSDSRSSGSPPSADRTTAFARAPKAATPTALPTERAKSVAPVATPRCSQPTDDWAATIAGLRRSRSPGP